MKVVGCASEISSDSNTRRSAALPSARKQNEIVLLIIWLWLAAFAASADSVPAQEPKVSKVQNSNWGGQHIGLEITDERSLIDFDCAHGYIDQPFEVDSTGAFDLPGAYVRESAGPIRKDAREERLRARYVGQIEGDAMTMTVKLTDSGETVGNFRLTKGALPGVSKCG